MSGDEFYDDEVTSPSDECWWCQDWADGFDPDPCPKHHVEDDEE